MKFLLIVCALVFSSVALVLANGDVAGLWTGTIDIHDESSGTTITTPVRIEFDQQSAALSGKIGRPEDAQDVPITNCRREGNKLWFEASNGETAGPVKFALTMVDVDHMEGDMITKLDTENINGKVKVARTKK